jgi:hypothetical protein
VEDPSRQSRERLDVPCGYFVGGVPFVECETDCDGFLVCEVAYEESTCESEGLL